MTTIFKMAYGEWLKAIRKLWWFQVIVLAAIVALGIIGGTLLYVIAQHLIIMMAVGPVIFWLIRKKVKK